MTYHEQLKDDRWKRKREKIIQHADHRCQICGKESPLDVYHSYYISGAKAWEYHDGALIAICRECHGRVHDKNESKPAFRREPEESRTSNSAEETDDAHMLLLFGANPNLNVREIIKIAELQYGWRKSKCYSIAHRLEIAGKLLFTKQSAHATTPNPTEYVVELEKLWNGVLDAIERCCPYLSKHFDGSVLASYQKNVAVLKVGLSSLSKIDNSKVHTLLQTKFAERGYCGAQFKFLGV